MKIIGKYVIENNNNLDKYKQLIELCSFANFDIIVINNREKQNDLTIENLKYFNNLNSNSIYIVDSVYGLKLIKNKIKIIDPNIQYIIITQNNIKKYLTNNLNSIIG